MLVLGLGNPGERYARTRHNVGWWVLDELRRRWHAEPVPGDTTYRAWRIAPHGRAAQLVQPLTYMNLSGDALEAWRERNGADVAGALLVVADDVYLPVGVIRLRAGGSSGGHRGLDSVEQALGTREFARLRIGVGGVASVGLKDYVLEELEGEEAAGVEEAVRLASDAVECWLGEGLRAAMNRFNRKVPKEATET